MTETQRDNDAIDTISQQVHGCRVTQHVMNASAVYWLRWADQIGLRAGRVLYCSKVAKHFVTTMGAEAFQYQLRAASIEPRRVRTTST